MNTRAAMKVIGWTTLIAGSVDFLYASTRFVLAGRSVEKLWQYVASGALGEAAASLGMIGAACGVLFHFLIMALFSAFLFLVYKKIPLIDKWPIVAGVLYGLGMWLVMNMLVVPLSRVGHGFTPLTLEMMMNLGFLVHLILGVLIVLVTKRGIAKYQSTGQGGS